MDSYHNGTLLELPFDDALYSGDVYRIYRDGQITGAMVLEYDEDLMNVLLLGGENIQDWKESLWDFGIKIMEEKGLNILSVIGRYGWRGLFDKMRPSAILYTFDRGI